MSKVSFPLAALTIFGGFSVALNQDSVDAQQVGNQPVVVRPTVQQDDYQSRRTGAESQQEGTTVKEAIVQKLMKANEAEIELAKMAQQKTDNQELQQLTQMIVKDHEALNQKLKEFMSEGQSQYNSSREGQSNDAVSQRQAGRDQASQVSQTSGQNNESAIVPEKLCKIAEEACANSLKMTKEMLSRYEGQDFQMAFLGQQCVAHTMMLAELKAIESVGPAELQPIAKMASQKVEQHLEKAKELAKKLEDDAKNRS